MGKYVVELVGYDTVADAEETLLFAKGAGISFTDHPPARSGLLVWESVSQRIEVSRDGRVQSLGDGGEIVIANTPRAITEAGPWDHVATWRWRGQIASLYWVPGGVWANRTLVARALMEQPVANLSTDGEVESKLIFPLRDPRAGLDAPLLTQKYAGDNIAPNGFEGDEDLKGKTKPLIIGPCSNFEPDPVNASKLIYQLSVAPGTVLCVRDGAIPLTAGTVRGTQASMEAAHPDEGGYDIYSGPEGLFIRLGTPPFYRLTCDATTGAAEADRTHAQVWKTLRTTYCDTDAGDIDDDSVELVDGLATKEVGFLFRDESRRDAIDRVLASLSGYERQNLDGSWTIGQLRTPDAGHVLSLKVARPGMAMTIKERALTRIDRARPSYAADGVPPYRMSTRWGLNNTVMNAADFSGGAHPVLKTKFRDQWRVETATDETIWDPTDDSGDFPGAPELTVETGYQPGADGRSCEHAFDEARRLLSLYSSLAGSFETGFKPVLKTGFNNSVLVGETVKLTYAGHDLEDGPLFVCLHSRFRLEVGRSLPEVTLLLGFPGPDVMPYLVLLMGFDDQEDESQVFIDESPYARTMTPEGNTTDVLIYTGITPLGNGSMHVDSGAVLATDSAPELNLSSNPFTLQGFARWSDPDGTFQSTSGLLQHGNGNLDGEESWTLARRDATHFGFYGSDDGSLPAFVYPIAIEAEWAPAEDTTYFYQVTRDEDGYVRVHIGQPGGMATMIAKGLCPHLHESAAGLVVGGRSLGGFYRAAIGNHDEVRILNGVSVWSRDASFPVPSFKFPRP